MSWLDRFFTGGIKNVAIAGTLLAQEVTLNFVTGATGVDNAAQSRSDISINALTAPTGTGFVHITGGSVDAAARAVNVSTADVTGVLGTANGGTGLSSVGSNGQVLTVVTGAPAWANASLTAYGSDLVNSAPANQYVSSLSFSSAAAGGDIAINGTATRLVWAANAAPKVAQTSVGSGAVNMIHAPQAATTTGASGSFEIDIANPGSGSANGGLYLTQAGAATMFAGQLPGSTSGQATVWFGITPAAAGVGNFQINYAGGVLALAGNSAGTGQVQLQAGGQNLVRAVYNGSTATYSVFLGNTAVTDGGGSQVVGIGTTGLSVPTAAPTNAILLWANAGSPGSLGLFSTGVQFHRLAGAITISQDTPTTNVATTGITLQAQTAFASATGSNRNGASLTLAGGAATDGTLGASILLGGGTQTGPQGTIGAVTGATWSWTSFSVTTTTGTVTLSSSQYNCPLILISPTLTGNLTVAFPNQAGYWIVNTNGLTLSGHTLTLQSGTATFSAATGKVYLVITQGSNTINASSG